MIKVSKRFHPEYRSFKIEHLAPSQSALPKISEMRYKEIKTEPEKEKHTLHSFFTSNNIAVNYKKIINEENYSQELKKKKNFKIEHFLKVGKNIFKKKRNLENSFDYQILRRGNKVFVLQENSNKSEKVNISELKSYKSELNKKYFVKKYLNKQKFLKPLTEPVRQEEEIDLQPWEYLQEEFDHI